jgi:hypothetical protein
MALGNGRGLLRLTTITSYMLCNLSFNLFLRMYMLQQIAMLRYIFILSLMSFKTKAKKGTSLIKWLSTTLRPQ